MTVRTRPTTWLRRHFFGELFDFGILSTAGADSFKHMLLGGIGGLVVFGLWMTYVYAGKYASLWNATPDRFRRAVLGDDLFIVGLPMLLVAFVTLLVSRSLFPSEHDLRILGPLPIDRTVVFRAKLSALAAFSGAIILVAHVALLPLMLLTSINPAGDRAVLRRLVAWVIAGAAGSMFSMLAVTAIVGVLTLTFSRGRFHELTGIIKSGLLALLVLCLPFVVRMPRLGGALADGAAWLSLVPPAWFVGVEQVLRGRGEPWFLQLAGIAVAALLVAAAIVAIVYAALFRHTERFMLHSAARSPAWAGANPSGRFSLERWRWRRSPAFRAVHAFTVLTLRRSELHQGVLVGLSACGIGLMFSVAVAAPFVLMFVCGIAARAALVLPMEHRANWIFRMTEDEATRRDQLRAVDWIVAVYVVGVPATVAMPMLWLSTGSVTSAMCGAAIVAFVGLVVVHVVLLNWRRIPFTCSYLPGKRFIASTLLRANIAFTCFALAGSGLVRAATGSVARTLAIATVLGLIAFLLRRQRLAGWRHTPLMFDDELPDRPMPLQL